MWLMYDRTKDIVIGSLENNILPPTPDEVTTAIGTQIFGVVGSADFPVIWAFSHSLDITATCRGPRARIAGAGLWLARVPQPCDRRLPVDPDPSHDPRAFAVFLSKQHRVARQQRAVGLQNIPGLRTVSQATLSLWFFWASAVALGAGYLLFAWMTSGKFGSVIRAIRDNEARGCGSWAITWKPTSCSSSHTTAMIAGVAGALYYPQAGIINPAPKLPLSRRSI